MNKDLNLYHFLRRDSVVIMRLKRLVSVALAAIMGVSTMAVTAVSTSAASLKTAPPCMAVSSVDHGINIQFKPTKGVTKYRLYYRWSKSENHTRCKTITVNDTSIWQSAYIGINEVSPDADLEALMRKHNFSPEAKDMMICSDYNEVPLYITVRGVNNSDTGFTTGFVDETAVWGKPYSMYCSNLDIYGGGDYYSAPGTCHDVGDLSMSYFVGSLGSYSYSSESSDFDSDFKLYARDINGKDWVNLGVPVQHALNYSNRVLNITNIVDKYPECIDKNGDMYLTCRKATKENTFWDCCIKIVGAKYANSLNRGKYMDYVDSGKIRVEEINMNKSDDSAGRIAFSY